MQLTAAKKGRELGFDLNKGRLSLEETLINLKSDRDILIDATDQQKLVQLPLKIQYTLFLQTQKISEFLTALVNGTDSVVALEDAVDDLTASIWQYNLHNLSGQVLGFSSKMNQLKSQETFIQRVHREAQEFEGDARRSRELLAEIEGIVSAATEKASGIPPSLEQISSLVNKATEQEQVLNGIVIRIQQSDTSAAQHEANAKASDAEIHTIAGRIPAVQAEIESAQSAVTELSAKATALLASFQTASDESLAAIRKDVDSVTAAAVSDVAEMKATIASLVSTTSAQLNQMNADQKSYASDQIDVLTASAGSQVAELKASVESQLSVASNELSQMKVDQESRLKRQLTTTGDAFSEATKQFGEDGRKAVSASAEAFDAYQAEARGQHSDLVKNLEALEGQIRESIRRATGFSLFHSFQTRQHELARSKNVWAIALSCIVAVSVGLSAWFIWYLNHIQTYGPAFYLKLSISLPIIYALTFCSLQYSRERRLEEEYAFKSSISISLEPYQKLVEGLVNKDRPEELEKYTAFVIESVGRVFTSPTGLVFGEHQKESDAAVEGIVKAVTDVLKVVLKK